MTFCTDALVLPIYRSFMTYWTEERKEQFRAVCQEVLQELPNRKRQKFTPLLFSHDSRCTIDSASRVDELFLSHVLPVTVRGTQIRVSREWREVKAHLG
jgi:hypothetical protein